MMKSRLLCLLSSVSLLVSCVVGPHYKKPAAPSDTLQLSKYTSSPTAATKTPLGESQKFSVNQKIPAQWWTLFHSKTLTRLVEKSLKQHPDVIAARAALHGALETLYAQQGALFPFVGFSFVPSKQQAANILTSVLASNQYDYALFTGQLFVSYTPDVFGGTRRQLESLTAQAAIQKLQLEATYLTLSSNVVNAAIQEASLREQIDATNTMIDTQTKILAIARKQYRLGEVSRADVALQEASLATSKAALAPLEKQLSAQQHLLHALTGSLPNAHQTFPLTLDAFTLPTKLPRALPSTLLEHRPDIRAAEEEMRSANALIGVAVSNRLPNVSIGLTNAGTSATTLNTLFAPDTTFWAIAGIITHPIFDGGTLMHRQRFAEAMYEQAVAQYKSTVINAFQNVADTLDAIHFDAIALTSAKQAERATYKSVTISRHQFKVGDTTMLALLVNEQLHQQAKINLIQAKANRLADTVALFQALGGGWWVASKAVKKEVPQQHHTP